MPSFRDNLAVLRDEIHLADVLEKHYPEAVRIRKALEGNWDRVEKAAWDGGNGVNFPAFLLPVRPLVSLWLTTIIKWDSYGREELIVKNLRNFGIEWVMDFEEDKLVFLSPEDYAKKAVGYDRYPKTIYFPYNLPPELTTTRL
jgi:hypothetical protein